MQSEKNWDFNTSHVSINLNVCVYTFFRQDFNTSHVSINRKLWSSFKV